MSADTEFLKDPGKFISSAYLSVPSNVSGGKGKYGLSPQSANFCILKEGGGLNAFYLKAQPDSNNQTILPDDVDVMVTDALSGCQFLAYGNRRSGMVVEHNNYIGDPGRYATRLTEIEGLGGATQLISVTDTGAEGCVVAGGRVKATYDKLATAMIVGKRDSGGWKFWLRVQGQSKTGTVHGPL